MASCRLLLLPQQSTVRSNYIRQMIVRLLAHRRLMERQTLAFHMNMQTTRVWLHVPLVTAERNAVFCQATPLPRAISPLNQPLGL